jgi:hypothetical protein
VAKKFGKKRKPGNDPRDLFGAPGPPPRSAARPASSTPLADYLAPKWPGVDDSYVVLPRSLAEGMSLPWQQQMAALLAQFHQAHGNLSWPVYRVVPSRYENLVDLDEEQLAEAGYLVEIDADGDMVYRERSGRKVEDPETTRVLVSVLDPIPPRNAVRAEAAEPTPDRLRAAPMNIPPAPVWRTTPTAPSAEAEVPPLPEPARKAPPAAAGAMARSAPGDSDAAGRPWVAPLGFEVPEQSGSAEEHGQAPAGAEDAPADEAPGQPDTAEAPAQPGGTEATAQPQASPPQPESEPMPWKERAAQLDPQPEQPQPEQPQPDTDTPPRGIPAADRGWFDEYADEEPVQFGPTGQPTELPYRYRP